jgi:metal-dependent hydrolase (beta-lactamase superfamily II)
MSIVPWLGHMFLAKRTPPFSSHPANFDALVLSHGHYDHFGGMVGFLSANKGKLKKNLPFFVGGEDCFCTRESGFGQYGALDRKAILDAELALMMAEGSAVVAYHAFITGKIPQVSSEKPLQPTREKVGIINGFGCFPDKMSAAKSTGTFIPDDFEHEIGTNFLLKGKGLVILTSCSHRGIINTIRQAQAVSGIKNVHAVIGGFHIVPPLNDDYIRDVVATLKQINPDYLIPAHCSGERFYDLARNELGDKVHSLGGGNSVRVYSVRSDRSWALGRRGDRVKRREIISLLGGAAAWPFAARAQQPQRIVLLNALAENDPEAQAPVVAFRPGLEAIPPTCAVTGDPLSGH